MVIFNSLLYITLFNCKSMHSFLIKKHNVITHDTTKWQQDACLSNSIKNGISQMLPATPASPGRLCCLLQMLCSFTNCVCNDSIGDDNQGSKEYSTTHLNPNDCFLGGFLGDGHGDIKGKLRCCQGLII